MDVSQLNKMYKMKKYNKSLKEAELQSFPIDIILLWHTIHAGSDAAIWVVLLL